MDGKTVEPCAPHFEFYPIPTENGKEPGKNDGKGLVVLSIPGDTEHNLSFEFPCGTLLELYNALDDGSALLNGLSTRKDAVAFAQYGGKITSSRLEGFTPEQASRLKEEVAKVFVKNTPVIKLLGKRYLAAKRRYPQIETDVLLAVYSAEALNAELERITFENTITNMAVRDGNIAAAIDEADGRFIAHTDPQMRTEGSGLHRGFRVRRQL